MDRVYGSRDHGRLSVHDGLIEREEVVGVFYQWRHLEVKLRRWSHDGTQQRRLVVLRWRDDSGCEEERLEPGGCGG
jgi:hypothetical protein